MTQLTVAYILSPDKKEVYIVEKNKPNKPYLNKKLLGLGGHMEEGETPIECIKRELDEELSTVGLKEIKDNQITFRGFLKDPKMGRVDIFIVELDYKLEEKEVHDEGYCSYHELDFFKKHPDKLMPGDELMLEQLFFTNNQINIDFTEIRKNLI